jgi:hypothetical protein
VELARRFETAGRIAARHGRPRLAAEIGEEAAGGLWRERQRAAAIGLRLHGLMDEAAAAAAALDLPIVWLKFAALEQAGLLPAGSREAADVDLLAPADRAEHLAAALRARGWRSSPLPGYDHHLPGLQHPDGGAVEIHRSLPGVRPTPGAPSATLTALAAAGLLRPAPASRAEPPPAPADPVSHGRLLALPALVAHLVAHALGQHASSPHVYSLLKTVADLIDVGAVRPDAEAAIRRARSLIAADVPSEEVDALLDLAAALAAGDDLLTAEAGRAARPAAILLRHILAGRLAADYAAALRLSVLRPPIGDGSRARRLAAATAATLFLSRAQVDAIYGPPRRPLGYLARQLARPFDLLGRLGRYRLRSWRAGRRRPE